MFSIVNVTRKRTKLSKLMCHGENLGEVKIELDNLDLLFEDYVDKYRLLIDSLTTEDSIENEELRYEEREKAVMEFRAHVQNWVSLTESSMLSCDDSVSQASKSSKSSKSSQASKSSKSSKSSQASKSSKSSQASKSSNSPSSSLTKVRAHVAELLVEKEILTKKQELKAAEEELALKTEIEKARARAKAYEEAQDMDAKPVRESTLLRTPASFNYKPQTRKSRLNPKAKDFKPRNLDLPGPCERETPHPDQLFHALQNRQFVEDMANSYHQLTAAISLPQPKVPVFKGDPTEYVSFIMAFGACDNINHMTGPTLSETIQYKTKQFRDHIYIQGIYYAT